MIFLGYIFDTISIRSSNWAPDVSSILIDLDPLCKRLVVTFTSLLVSLLVFSPQVRKKAASPQTEASKSPGHPGRSLGPKGPEDPADPAHPTSVPPPSGKPKMPWKKNRTAERSEDQSPAALPVASPTAEPSATPSATKVSKADSTRAEAKSKGPRASWQRIPGERPKMSMLGLCFQGGCSTSRNNQDLGWMMLDGFRSF